jgi:hypothetical protein
MLAAVMAMRLRESGSGHVTEEKAVQRIMAFDGAHMTASAINDMSPAQL